MDEYNFQNSSESASTISSAEAQFSLGQINIYTKFGSFKYFFHQLIMAKLTTSEISHLQTVSCKLTLS